MLLFRERTVLQEIHVPTVAAEPHPQVRCTFFHFLGVIGRDDAARG